MCQPSAKEELGKQSSYGWLFQSTDLGVVEFRPHLERHARSDSLPVKSNGSLAWIEMFLYFLIFSHSLIDSSLSPGFYNLMSCSFAQLFAHFPLTIFAWHKHISLQNKVHCFRLHTRAINLRIIQPSHHPKEKSSAVRKTHVWYLGTAKERKSSDMASPGC